ncbi:hypothetical protein [Streptomyces galbus]|uniref:Uncharacterized protein n=1 Tax=Streptomyces galbus TaxID=33898 RepID=A0A4U5W6G2_STRGB|nr:hypothetical protein [Streptomyces galbus]TKS97008.1 hypothetical protein E4U92_33915 [Streptomyces galbus]GHD51240.1 hypothetical protein GCM10010335_62620 [Streptomyces galbus]
MADQEEHREDRAADYARARDPEEPGAHSGAESQARDRSVPGTASSKEGYQPDHGTTAGRPLEGVEVPEGTAGAAAGTPDGEDDGGSTDRG